MKDDASLVAQVRSGDDDAWTAIVEQHWQQVWGLSRTIVRDQQGAEEVVLDTFRLARERLTGTLPEAGLCAWLLSICRGQALVELRRRGRQLAQGGSGQPATAYPDLERALGGLDDDEVQALLLTAAGCTSDELAVALGVAPAAIRSRRARARSRLLAELGGAGL